MRRYLIVFGTRPEAIKMAPIVREMRNRTDIETVVCVTAQHREMLDQVLAIFDVVPDVDLNIMQPGQTLSDITVRTLKGIEGLIGKDRFAAILVHGDTTTAMAAALAGFYGRVPVAHVEAGLRTGDINTPFPEEMNRVFVDTVSSWLFAPTERARDNLIREGCDAGRVAVTGNTVIDALLTTSQQLEEDPTRRAEFAKHFNFLDPSRRLIVITGHRRESFGEGIKNVCLAIQDIAERGDVDIVYPVHLNRNIAGPVHEILDTCPNVHLIEPLDYLSFVYLMNRAAFVITDSGGIQEEAPALGKPVLVTRDTTERPEAIDAGTARLVGTNRQAIVTATAELLDDEAVFARMAKAQNPFGDGSAARQIVDLITSN